MQIKSNALVKFIVPAVVIAGLAVGLKSCKNEPAEQPQAKQSGSLKNLSPDELKALGVEGDTPEDTLRTLIGRLNDVRDRQKTLDKQNADLVKENERLRRRNQDVSGQVNEAVNGLREQYDRHRPSDDPANMIETAVHAAIMDTPTPSATASATPLERLLQS